MKKIVSGTNILNLIGLLSIFSLVLLSCNGTKSGNSEMKSNSQAVRTDTGQWQELFNGKDLR